MPEKVKMRGVDGCPIFTPFSGCVLEKQGEA
jgi:hypothetical protein